MQAPPRNPASVHEGRHLPSGAAELRTGQNEQTEGPCPEQLCSPELHRAHTQPGFQLPLSAPAFHGSTAKEGPLWYLCGGKQNKSICESCSPKLDTASQLLATATAVHRLTQGSDAKWACMSERGRAENRRFGWCEPKASVVLPAPGTCVCI